ncbi:MAG: hypothetical protein EZS28_015562 [Streblomastix strix]|uniref:RRM domain-containing protein n=1 Tax=Streblomastix strix TaxID=222440 RepID=A0A5J4W2H5_9EUKA|nr:MAG: hypothetical protein EZS28_015562 [Streblomastix strix]
MSSKNSVRISNIQSVYSEGQIKEFAKRFGSVKSFRYVKGAKNEAFITYSSHADAESAVNAPSGKRRFASSTLEFEWDK